MNQPVGAEDSAEELHGPRGQALHGGRRMTYRQARTWLKRSDLALGIRPCGVEIHWIPETERQAVVDRLRRAEGKDCNVAGDVLLYRLPDENVIVVEQPYWE